MTPEQEQLLQNVVDRLNKLEKSDRYIFQKTIQMFDGRNFQLGNTTGTKFGTSATQKASFFGATPVVQAGAISSPAADVASLKTAVDAIRTAIKNFGITA